MPRKIKFGPSLTREELIKKGAKPFERDDLTFDFLSPKEREIYKQALNQYRIDEGKEPLFD